jgi:hypothetical protein
MCRTDCRAAGSDPHGYAELDPSRKPLSVVWRIEGSNPSPSAHTGPGSAGWVLVPLFACGKGVLHSGFVARGRVCWCSGHRGR